jgi:DNA-binding NarL/FixJ family response regulator
MSEKVITVAIADDHALFREGVRQILRNFDNIDLIMEAENGQDLITKLKNKVPDVLLLDLEMQVMDGIETLKYLKQEAAYEDLKVLILSMYREERMIAYLMELGANGYLMKDADPDEFELAIRTVHKEGFYFNEHVSHAMLGSLKQKTKKIPSLGNNFQITEREMDVLQLIAQGMTTTEIGEKLFISNRTVEGHRKNLLSKLDARNTASLIMKAIKAGLISEHDL